jgi:hypothetical protein
MMTGKQRSGIPKKNHERRYKKSLFAGMGYRERKKGGNLS